jgi:pyrroline-5-carboxylate reductase
MHSDIAFIGGGNMARSLIGGLITDGYPAQHIHVSEPDTQKQQHLIQQFNIQILDNNRAAVEKAELIVLATKPQTLRSVAVDLHPVTSQHSPLLLSIAAGIRTSHLSQWFGDEVAIVRAMPNTPALVQSGATALYANSRVSDEGRSLAESVLRAVGLTLWVDDESLMDAVTALSGSGPAYFFRIMEILEGVGQQMGLPPETARLLTIQTALGSAKMALESTEALGTLRSNVTSKGGTTESALAVLQEQKLDKVFEKALKAAQHRSITLAKELGD